MADAGIHDEALKRGGEMPPASFAQERLWVLHQLDPFNPSYHMHAAVRFRGDLDADALERSLQFLAARHETLRTAFQFEDGSLFQAVQPGAAVRLDRQALSEAKLDDAIQSALRQPFRLSEVPLLRAYLFELEATDEHVLLLVMHHIVSDAWSMAVIATELGQIYNALRAARQPDLPPLVVQYADFSRWQRDNVLDGEGLTYWKAQLGTDLPFLDLSSRRPAQSYLPWDGGSIPFKVNRELSGRLIQLAQSEGATPYMGLLAAFAALLHRYSGQASVIIGSPFANRNQSEIEPLIGFFVNMIPMRLEIRADTTFRDLLRAARRVSLEAFDHGDVPFERIVEELQPERDPTRTPIFQATLALEDMTPATLQFDGLQTTPLAIDTHTAMYDLNLFVTHNDGEVGGNLRYRRQLIEDSFASGMVRHLAVLIEDAVAAPNTPIDYLALLDSAEIAETLDRWNDTAKTYNAPPLIHEMFEQQAALTPDALAVIFEGETLTYRELNECANRLAHRLRALGVGPEAPVGLFMERSLNMPVALWATLKAGAAYVPLDPDFPPDWVEYVLNDAGVSVLISHEKWRDRTAGRVPQVVVLDAADSHEDHYPVINPSHNTFPESLLYVIYTSGSTGKPKGVMLTHEGLRNRFLDLQDEYALDASHRILQKTTFSFDVSVWEIFWPHLFGAAIVLPTPGMQGDPLYIARLIDETQVTMLHFIPTMLEVFMSSASPDLCSSLRYLICGGEFLPYDLRQRVFRFCGASLHNHYGPTEGSVEVTTWPCERSDSTPMAPIGVAIANSQIYILDRAMQPVPVGSPGELYFGGLPVARGYLGKPGLTADRFLPDPFSKGPGGRLYRTGDLARYRDDGAIEFLGRNDHQVKIRGYRVELGEVQAALALHPDIADVQVVMREDVPGAKMLVAYVIAHRPVQDPVGFLRRTLPAYMVPSSFVYLDKWPLTSTGKLDRSALPPPDRSSKVGTLRVPAATPIEEELVMLWQTVLGVSEIGVLDNFFDLGGYSLLAVRVLSSIYNRFGVVLPLRTMFEALTVRSLAARIEEELLLTAGADLAADTLAAVDALTPAQAEMQLGRHV